MNECQHKWVIYQPFQGEAFECCANCDMTKEKFLVTLPRGNQSQQTDFEANEETFRSGWVPWMGSGNRRDDA